jgi:2,4-dienoyl-CoA reductase-like NADH-dependent reductase (Old Yellow Enzyme family)
MFRHWRGHERPPDIEILGPSAVFSAPYGVIPRAITKEEIKEFVKDFGQAARRAKEAGLDALEVQGSHGYFISAFLSPLRNRRTDEYGGSLENRARFACEILASCRQEVGADFPIIFRFNAAEIARQIGAG